MALTEGQNERIPEDQIQDPDLRKVSKWVAEIQLYEKEERTWRERRKKIIRRYKDDRSPREDEDVRFNILWSMVQTLKPALLAKTPKPDIQRRFKDADPVGRVASDVLERAVSYFVQEPVFYEAMRADVEDYLLLGRGTAWVRYVPTFSEPQEEVTDDTGKEGEVDEPLTSIDYEEVEVDFVHAEDFGHNICRTWPEVWCVWRKVYLTRAELVRRFKDKGLLPPLDYRRKGDRDQNKDEVIAKSVIYEVWDETRDCAVWLHKDIPEALDLRKDPLGLEDFFPCPKPLYATIANDSLIPVPDYIEWQDQAVELDNLTARIGGVQKALKVAGVYDASAQGISKLLAEGTQNQLIPVESWAMFAEKGGIKGAMDFLPLEDIANGLLAMYEARDKVKEDLYEITGIADIIRGQSDPDETMGAQQIKANFATMRLSDRQADVQRFIRDTIRLMVDVISNHFQLETIKEISGVRLFTKAEKAQLQGAATMGTPPANTPPQAGSSPLSAAGPTPASSPGGPVVAPSLPLPSGLTQDQFDQMMSDPTWEEVEALIRNKPMRCFRIDIETDSTIKADEIQDRQDRTEFLQAAGQYLQQATAAGAQAPEAIPLLTSLLMFGVRGYPIGKELEGQFESTIQKLEKKAQQAAANPQPNPEMIKVQGQMQLEQQKAQADIQIQQARAQSDVQAAQAKIQMEERLEQARIQAKQQSEAAEAQSSMAIDQRENELENSRQLAKMQSEENLARYKLELEYKTQVEVAHIRAAAQIEAARIAAAQSSGEDAEMREAQAEGSNGAQMP